MKDFSEMYKKNFEMWEEMQKSFFGSEKK